MAQRQNPGSRTKKKLPGKTDGMVSRLFSQTRQAMQPSSKGLPAPLKQPQAIQIRSERAKIIVSALSSLGVSFAGRSCIDIGCRSGENTLAMQASGAQEVIGIDPDSSEFNVAIQAGLQPSQLVTASLQDYLNKFRGKKFGIATVFLWNIPYTQYAAFAHALSYIIKPDGQVVITFMDAIYDERGEFDVGELMHTVFEEVKGPFILPCGDKTLICSSPRYYATVRTLNLMGVSFSGLEIICFGKWQERDLYAMHMSGAKDVIGFQNLISTEVALETFLQDSPNKKFDIVTVFSWELPLKHSDGFALALTKVIKPDGRVIIMQRISYDDPSPSQLFNLMTAHFEDVKKAPISRDRDREYVFICSSLKDQTPTQS